MIVLMVMMMCLLIIMIAILCWTVWNRIHLVLVRYHSIGAVSTIHLHEKLEESKFFQDSLTYRFVGSHGQNSDTTRPCCSTSEESTNCCQTFQFSKRCCSAQTLCRIYSRFTSPEWNSKSFHLRNETHLLPSLALCRLREALRLRLRLRLLLRLRLRLRLGERRVTASGPGNRSSPFLRSVLPKHPKSIS